MINTDGLVDLYRWAYASATNPGADPDDLWHQEQWGQRMACGSTYCIAGETVRRDAARGGCELVWTVDPGDETEWRELRAVIRPDGNRVLISTHAAGLLGLDATQASELFHAYNTLEDIRGLILRYTGVDPHPTPTPAATP